MFKIEFRTANKELISKVNAFLNSWNDESEAIDVQTSGSTGKPKVIVLRKDFMRASAAMTGSFFGLNSGDKTLLCLSVDTIAGKMMLVRSVVLNLHLIVVEPGSELLNELNEELDFAALVPLQIEAILKDDRKSLQRIRTVIIGGAPISPALFKKIAEIHDNAYQTFGMTETISHIAVRKICEDALPFEVLPGVKIQSVEGNLQINAPHLGVEKLLTSDLVELTDQRHFFWKGRSDFVINSGGVKIHPEEIENLLSPLIEPAFFVTGLDDEKFGQKMVLVIEGKVDLNKTTLMKVLPPYHCPKEIYFLKNFHYTSSAKIDRLKTTTNLNYAEKQVL